MAIKNSKGKWICSVCRQVKKNPSEADACRDKHDIVYVGFERADLNRLLHFIYQPDPSLITQTMVSAMRTSLRLGIDKQDKIEYNGGRID